MEQILRSINKIAIRCLFLFFFLPVLTGCAFTGLKKDLKEQEKLATLHGEVVAASATSAPIIIAILADDPLQPRLINYRVLTEPGEFIFIVKPEKYRVFAFEDSNRDQHFQPGERVGKTEPIHIQQPGTDSKVTVQLPDNPDLELAKKITGLKSRVIIDLPAARMSLGRVVLLDDPAFSKSNAEMGLWQPLRSTREIPLGIFFLEDFDPEKIPVLLVHGVAGSPVHFEKLVARMDRKKFQPWVVFYPSGFNIPLIAEYLNSLTRELHVRHGFNTMKIVAYSMGGLASRAFLNVYAESPQPFAVDCFITVSTPWNGHDAANMGLKYAPAVIPVWNDIVPGSQFLKSLFSTTLPGDIPHYLLFGFKGESALTSGNNDGTVSIASQLRPEAQTGSIMVRGFDENHTSILRSKEVSELINEILNR